MLYKLREVASIIRSKNAGPYELTLDVLLKDDEMFKRMHATDVINKQRIAQLYGVEETSILSIIYFPQARAIKVTMVRPLPSGDLAERDVYGAQQHAPLMEFVFDM